MPRWSDFLKIEMIKKDKDDSVEFITQQKGEIVAISWVPNSGKSAIWTHGYQQEAKGRDREGRYYKGLAEVICGRIETVNQITRTK